MGSIFDSKWKNGSNIWVQVKNGSTIWVIALNGFNIWVKVKNVSNIWVKVKMGPIVGSKWKMRPIFESELKMGSTFELKWKIGAIFWYDVWRRVIGDILNNISPSNIFPPLLIPSRLHQNRQAAFGCYVKVEQGNCYQIGRATLTPGGTIWFRVHTTCPTWQPGMTRYCWALMG